MNDIKAILLGIAMLTALVTIQPIHDINGQQKLSAEEIFKNSENSIVGILLPDDEGYDRSRHDADVEYSGSGFVYQKDGNNLQIVTNHHVVEDERSVKVGFSDGSNYNGKVLGKDSKKDIAVVQIVWNSTRNQQPAPEPLVFANSSNLKVGEEVIAIGNSFYGCDDEDDDDDCDDDKDDTGQTFSNMLTKGVISKFGVYITDTDPPSIPNGIVTDAITSPGSSGGPILNMEGEVVGIIDAGGDDGMCCTYAIASNTAKQTVEEIS
jgi:serine protease Do